MDIIQASVPSSSRVPPDASAILDGVLNVALTSPLPLPVSTSSKSLVEEIQMTGFFNGKIARVFNILGRRAGFTSTTVLNDIKEFDNSVAAIPVLSNASLEIVSNSTDDSVAGIGARKVKITYIDSNNALVESTEISLNGQTPVPLVLTGVNGMWWMEVTSVGTNVVSVGTNVVSVGDVILRLAGGGAAVEQVSAGGNRSLSARCMIPAGYNGYLGDWNCHAVGNASQDMRIRATLGSFARDLQTPWHFLDNEFLASNTQGGQGLGFQCLPPLCKVKVSTVSGSTSSANRADASFLLVLMQQ